MSKNIVAIKSILEKPFKRSIIKDENGSFTATIDEFPGCYAQGATMAEALENLEEIAVIWLENAIENRLEIPLPTEEIKFSGRIALRVRPDVHRQAFEMAKSERSSMNGLLNDLIVAGLNQMMVCEKALSKIEGTAKRVKLG